MATEWSCCETCRAVTTPRSPGCRRVPVSPAASRTARPPSATARSPRSRWTSRSELRVMTWVVPVELEAALYAAAREGVGEARLAAGPLARAVVDRSRRYTSERERLAAPADRIADLAA